MKRILTPLLYMLSSLPPSGLCRDAGALGLHGSGLESGAPT